MPLHQDDVEFSKVEPTTVAYIWPHVVPMIERGLRHGQGDATTSDMLRHRVTSGQMLMWAFHRGGDIRVENILGVIILSVHQHATGKKLFVEMLAGRDYKAWQDELTQLLLDFRDIVGATCIEASCRKGLIKPLSELGWRQKSVIMELR